MLLGRQALRGRCRLDPGRSYLIGKKPRKKKKAKKREMSKTGKNKTKRKKDGKGEHGKKRTS
jgi:hypothetical protein